MIKSVRVVAAYLDSRLFCERFYKDMPHDEAEIIPQKRRWSAPVRHWSDEIPAAGILCCFRSGLHHRQR